MDLLLIKAKAQHYWKEIIQSAYGDIPWDSHREHPCPKCGGATRFRWFDDDTGGCICSHCHRNNNSDGFATIGWLTGKSFVESVKFVMEYVGMDPEEKPRPVSRKEVAALKDNPDKNALEDIDWIDALASTYAARKGVPVTSLVAVGAKMVRYRNKPVIAIPIFGSRGVPTGNVLLSPDERGIYHHGKYLDKKVSFRSRSGMCLELDKLAGCERVLKVEGITDMLCAIGWFDGCVVTNSNGAGEAPHDWFLDLIAGKELFVLGDADVPGMNGAVKWQKAVAGRNQKVHLLQLPYPVEPTKGKDLRFWRAEFPDKSIEDIPESKYSGTVLAKKVDDPSRLAELNLAIYEQKYKRSLRYWRGEWWKFDGTSYRLIQNHELRAKVRLSIQSELERYFVEEQHDEKEVRSCTGATVENTVQAMASVRIIPDSRTMPCWIDDSDRPRNIFACRNGLVDVDAYLRGDIDDCLTPSTPDWFSATSTEYDFDPKADCLEWIQFLREVIPSSHTRSMLQEWCGYCLLPQTYLQQGMILIGSGGNGKSSFEAGLIALIGDQNCSKTALESLKKDYGMVSMVGKLVNIAQDFHDAGDLAEGRIKAIISGDPIETDRKYLSTLPFKPTTRLVVATNIMPRFKDKSRGTLRRWVVVPFTQTFDESPDRKFGLDSYETWLKEAPGMLNWALAGLGRLQVNRKFSISEEIEEQNKAFKIESNPCFVFLSENFTAHHEAHVLCSEAYDLYRRWCRDNGYQPLNQAHFGREVSVCFPNIVRDKRATRSQIGRAMAYVGMFCIGDD